MSSTMKKQAFEVFELLTEREQRLIVELIESLAPDDIATPDDIASHEIAMQEYQNGETISLADID